MRGLLLLFLAASLANAQPATQPAHPLADLLAKVPAKLSEDPAVQSYDVAGEVHEILPVRFRAVRKNSAQRLLYIEYARDGVPMLVGINGEAILYDAVAGVVRRMKDVQPHFQLAITVDNIDLGGGVRWGDKMAKEVTAAIDLRSILQFSGNDVRSVREGSLVHYTGHSRRGSPCNFWVDETLPMPLVAVQMQASNRNRFLTLAKISVNQPVESNFSLPPDAELERLLPTKVYDKGFIDNMVAATLFMRSLAYRMALDNPEARPAVEKFAGKVDWDARRQQDATIGPALVKLLGQQIATDLPATRPAK